MNKFYAAVAAIAALVLASQFSSSLYADTDPGAPPDPQKMQGMKSGRQEKMLEMMTKKFNLTADQQKSMKAILDKRVEKMQSLGKNWPDQRKQLREATDESISKILNADQKKQFEQWKNERQEKMKARMDEHDK